MKKICFILFITATLYVAQQTQNRFKINTNKPDKIQLESDVHPYLTQDAYDLLINQHGEFLCSKLADNLETVLNFSYQEDFLDIVYGNGSLSNNLNSL